jgi:hypothetical protein
VDVAESFAAAGGLAADRVAAAVDGCVARLEQRYGRSVRPMGDVPKPVDGNATKE